jgi:hypothetical protein
LEECGPFFVLEKGYWEEMNEMSSETLNWPPGAWQSICMRLAHCQALPDNTLRSITFANPWKFEPSASGSTGKGGEHPDFIQMAF